MPVLLTDVSQTPVRAPSTAKMLKTYLLNSKVLNLEGFSAKIILYITSPVILIHLCVNNYLAPWLLLLNHLCDSPQDVRMLILEFVTVVLAGLIKS